jgi:DNA modification methylase
MYNEDCLEGMKRIADESVACIITSPPYNLGGDFHTFVAGKRVTYGDYNSPYKDKLDEECYQEWQVEFLNSCHRVLNNDGFMFYNHKNRIVENNVITPFSWIHKTGFLITQVVVMNLKSTPNVDKRRFFPVHELVFILSKNKKSKLNNIENLTDVWEMKKVSRKISGHPATFHDELPRRCIISSTKEQDIVLDPFMGSGTTAIACLNTNRNFIGFEISKEYFDIAEKRVKDHAVSKL